jgi:DNA repair protein RecO (recombination protein O)
MRITLQAAFVLHSRPFNETSLLLDVFTCTHGRIALIAKGARLARARFRGLLRPFLPLQLSWSGKTELMSLTAAECVSTPFHIQGNGLFSGLYLNELLVRVLPRFDPYPEIFHAYQRMLGVLHDAHAADLESGLRLFEKTLLAELGYGFALDKETGNGLPIQAERFYVFMPGRGLDQCMPHDTGERIFSGKSLLALHHGVLDEVEDLRAAKRLHRIAMHALLGEKRLKSRTFFQGAGK